MHRRVAVRRDGDSARRRGDVVTVCLLVVPPACVDAGRAEARPREIH
jgi:hypothetical protein